MKQKEIDKRPTPEVLAVGKMNFSGNIIPETWYKNIVTIEGKPDLAAIIILAEIVWWYRPREVREEATGRIAFYEKKFYADLLQLSYRHFEIKFGLTNHQVRRAFTKLLDLTVIKTELRTRELEYGKLPRTMYIEIFPKVLMELTYDARLNADDARLNADDARLNADDARLNADDARLNADASLYTKRTTKRSTKRTTKTTTFDSPNGENHEPSAPPEAENGKQPNDWQKLIGAACEACGLDVKLHAARAARAIAPLSKATIPATAELLLLRYGKPDGKAEGWNWFNHDWRGQKGQKPTLSQLVESWGNWEIFAPKTYLQQVEDAAGAGYDLYWKLRGNQNGNGAQQAAPEHEIEIEQEPEP